MADKILTGVAAAFLALAENKDFVKDNVEVQLALKKCHWQTEMHGSLLRKIQLQF
jgi:hypothetical protein